MLNGFCNSLDLKHFTNINTFRTRAGGKATFKRAAWCTKKNSLWRGPKKELCHLLLKYAKISLRFNMRLFYGLNLWPLVTQRQLSHDKAILICTIKFQLDNSGINQITPTPGCNCLYHGKFRNQVWTGSFFGANEYTGKKSKYLKHLKDLNMWFCRWGMRQEHT